MPKASLLLLTLLILGVRGHAQDSLAESTVLWAKQPGYDPTFIVAGANQNRGVGDLIFDKLQRHLPQYQHDTIRANYIRTLTEIRRGNNVCALLHPTAERGQFVHFSNTVLLTPTYHLYTLVSQKNRFSQLAELHNDKMRFNQLLANSQRLRMAHTRGHSYGKTLDDIFEQHRDNVQISKGHAGQKALIKMLLAGRVDFILELPLVLNYQLRELNIDYSEFHKVILSETPTYIPISVGCAKTPWGKSLVGALNKVLPALQKQIEELVVIWLAPEEAKAYRLAYSQYFEDKNHDQAPNANQQSAAD